MKKKLRAHCHGDLIVRQTIRTTFLIYKSQIGGVSCKGIKIENSRFTGIKTDFSRITHNSAFDFHGSREINSFFHDSRQLKNRRSRLTENPLSDPHDNVWPSCHWWRGFLKPISVESTAKPKHYRTISGI